MRVTEGGGTLARLMLLMAVSVVTSIGLPSKSSAIGICGSGARYTCVVDADTIWLDGVNYRLAGFDAPEEYNNACGGNRERRLARQATRRLAELLNSQPWQIQSLGQADRYRRVLANLYVSGEDVGNILIREGLARRWRDGPEFWCN